MEKEYIKMIENKDWEKLSKIARTSDLAFYKYKGKYLLEYLLEKNIRSVDMDEVVRYNHEFANLYLKYNIFEPIFSSSLSVLLHEEENGYFLDRLLSKLNNEQKLNLYDRIKFKDYNKYRVNEKNILECFRRNGVVLPSIFLNYTFGEEYTIRDCDRELIKQFSDVFSDQKKEVLNVYINEIKKRLLMNHDRAVIDTEKLIEYKKMSPKFTLELSKETDGKYEKVRARIEVSRYASTIYDHELSHLLFQIFENRRIIDDYEDIREKLDNKSNIEKFKKYLDGFHSKFEEKGKEYEKEYYDLINVKYGSFDNYLLFVCKDFYDNKDKIGCFILDIQTDAKLYDLSTRNSLEEIKKVVLEFLEIEKNEYITRNLRNYYGPYLMLENMLDAIVMGSIFDDLEDKCLSGHGRLYFVLHDGGSFDECLADFDAICKSEKKDEIIKELEKLIGKELIEFLEKYIEMNRERRHGNR